MQDSDIEKKKTPLHQAALDLAAICRQIDDSEEIPNALIKTLGEFKAELAHSIDRNILFKKSLEAQIAMSKEMKDSWAHRQKVLELVKENHSGYMLSAISQAGGVPFKGTHGEIRAQQSPPSMELTIKTDRRSFETLDPKDAETIPMKYITETRILSLNKEAVREDLQNGVEVPFAKFVRHKHIRVYI
jgi:hypothetical protein